MNGKRFTGTTDDGKQVVLVATVERVTYCPSSASHEVTIPTAISVETADGLKVQRIEGGIFTVLLPLGGVLNVRCDELEAWGESLKLGAT